MVLVAVLSLLAGCTSPRESALFTTSGPGWSVRDGQALWRPNQRYPEIAGDLVIATHPDGRCAIHFTKTPLPVVLAQVMPGRWHIGFPPRCLSFSGQQPPPSRFIWFQLMAALKGEPVTKNFRFARKPDGEWRLENARSGESLEGFLTP
jgi:hypothetical protein